jgi:hypothetical protein
MAYEGVTQTKFGRSMVPDPMHFEKLHWRREQLKEIEHSIPIPVLDQEDLIKQGIIVSSFIPSAPANVDALGSCTANATTASLSERYASAGKDLPAGLSASDVKANEEFAIKFYNVCTDQTGDPSQEWPPTDCGSTGLFCCTELEKQKLITSYESGSTVHDAISMLQAGTVIQGTPFFNSWMSVDSEGFVDGDGSPDALRAAVESGVAGGHETCQYAIPQLGQTLLGGLDLKNTVIKVRNSWSDSWGLSGSFLIHASTLDYLAQFVDYKSFVL